MRLKSASDGREYDVVLVARDGNRVRLRIDAREVSTDVTRLSDGSAVLSIDERRWQVFAARRKGATLVAVGPNSYEFTALDDDAPRRSHGLATPEVTAPMPGKVLRILVTRGQVVGAGDGLIVLEAMKMETTLGAESAAVVKRVLVKEGEMVDHGAVLIELGPAPSLPESRPPNP
jgi:acetyl/propionyl-CoA carboxylase alpha subunit